ncbi:MAG: hypothetical protein IKX93_05105, partial [Bacteroidaceae bacterium]|nr:hypothetical protein [Bacteroidaceae bacterium]
QTKHKTSAMLFCFMSNTKSNKKQMQNQFKADSAFVLLFLVIETPFRFAVYTIYSAIKVTDIIEIKPDRRINTKK